MKHLRLGLLGKKPVGKKRGRKKRWPGALSAK
jgi:hypothetical protein